jgi:hypothetical protein
VFKEPYNKRFINLVLLSLYGKVFAFGLSAQTSLLRRSVCTKTSGKYFPVQTSLSVNNPLLLAVLKRNLGHKSAWIQGIFHSYWFVANSEEFTRYIFDLLWNWHTEYLPKRWVKIWLFRFVSCFDGIRTPHWKCYFIRISMAFFVLKGGGGWIRAEIFML